VRLVGNTDDSSILLRQEIFNSDSSRIKVVP